MKRTLSLTITSACELAYALGLAWLLESDREVRPATIASVSFSSCTTAPAGASITGDLLESVGL